MPRKNSEEAAVRFTKRLNLMMVWIVAAGAVERIGDFAQAARAVDLIDQLFNSSEKRLARTLLLLANFGKEATIEPVIGKFSQETLAEMIGTTRSRVSFS